MLAQANLLGVICDKIYRVNSKGVNHTQLLINTTKTYPTNANERKKVTSIHRVNCYAKLSNIIEQKCKVGDLIYIQGDIENTKKFKGNTEQWEYFITATQIKLLPQNKAFNG